MFPLPTVKQPGVGPLPAPPPEPPGLPGALGFPPEDPPAPPPADVIVENTEFDPFVPFELFDEAPPGDVPPPPTVIGYVVAVTVIPVVAANGEAV